jgi:hypothetical protein
MTRLAFGQILLAGVVLGACGSGPAPQRSAAPPARAPDAGRIRGVVRLEGLLPPRALERVPKDQDVCGGEVAVTRLAVDESQGVQHAFVYLEDAPASESPRPRAVVPLEQARCEYLPHALHVASGTQLEIVNGDRILHNVHARQLTDEGPQTIFNIAQPMQGQRTVVDLPLSRPGIVALTCEAGHPWMSAYILVAGHPYAAVTEEGGRFAIDDVPPGTYRIRMWHEGVRLKAIFASLQRYDYEEPYQLTKEVVVPPGGEAEVNFAFALRP